MRTRLCALGVACALTVAGAVAAAAPQRVLFIGNSLTTVNDVPGRVRRLARDAGTAFDYRIVAFDGFSLEDHWHRGDARRAIAEGGWTMIVLQQGPSALPESRVLLVEYAQRFAAEARRVGARTALYMVWPDARRAGDFDGVHDSYAAAARAVGGVLLPAGDAWRAAWRRDPSLALYGSDGFHPTPTGSALAALVIFEAFFPRMREAQLPDVPRDRAALLKAAAAEALGR